MATKSTSTLATFKRWNTTNKLAFVKFSAIESSKSLLRDVGCLRAVGCLRTIKTRCHIERKSIERVYIYILEHNTQTSVGNIELKVYNVIFMS